MQSAERPSGSVKLGLPHSISGALALPRLTAIRQNYTEITLQLIRESTGNLSVLLDDGQPAGFLMCIKDFSAQEN